LPGFNGSKFSVSAACPAERNKLYEIPPFYFYTNVTLHPVLPPLVTYILQHRIIGSFAKRKFNLRTSVVADIDIPFQLINHHFIDKPKSEALRMCRFNVRIYTLAVVLDGKGYTIKICSAANAKFGII
jgi:hypothetical protein